MRGARRCPSSPPRSPRGGTAPQSSSFDRTPWLKPPPDPLVPLPAPSRVVPHARRGDAPDPTSAPLLPSLDEPELNTSWLLAPPPPPFAVRICTSPPLVAGPFAPSRRRRRRPSSRCFSPRPATSSHPNRSFHYRRRRALLRPALQRSVQSRGDAGRCAGRPGAKCQPAARPTRSAVVDPETEIPALLRCHRCPRHLPPRLKHRSVGQRPPKEAHVAPGPFSHSHDQNCPPAAGCPVQRTQHGIHRCQRAKIRAANFGGGPHRAGQKPVRVRARLFQQGRAAVCRCSFTSLQMHGDLRSSAPPPDRQCPGGGVRRQSRAAPNLEKSRGSPAARRRSRGPRPNLSIISATRRSGAEGRQPLNRAARSTSSSTQRSSSTLLADARPTARVLATEREMLSLFLHPDEWPSSCALQPTLARTPPPSPPPRRARSDEHAVHDISGGRSRASTGASHAGRSGIAASQDQHAASISASGPPSPHRPPPPLTASLLMHAGGDLADPPDPMRLATATARPPARDLPSTCRTPGSPPLRSRPPRAPS